MEDCFDEDRGPQEDVKMRVGEGLKTFGQLKMTLNTRSVSLCRKRELYEGVAAPMVTYGTDIWDVRMDERRKLEVLEKKCLRSVGGATRMDRWRNEEVRRTNGGRKNMMIDKIGMF